VGARGSLSDNGREASPRMAEPPRPKEHRTQ